MAVMPQRILAGTSKVNRRYPPASVQVQNVGSDGMVGVWIERREDIFLSSLSLFSLVRSEWKREAIFLINGEVVIVDENSFHKVIQSQSPVIVDFWAVWCVPCRMISPILEEVAREQKGNVIVAKVNVDENPSIAAEYGIMSIPTIIRFKNGNETSRVVGALPKAQLLRKLGV